jgi:hypothetical protein
MTKKEVKLKIKVVGDSWKNKIYNKLIVNLNNQINNKERRRKRN